jgi:hypothetical protein
MPATSIAMHAYSSMFQGCAQMVKAPELPAPTLTNSCYNEMFRDCSSLSHIRCYATDISAYNCTYNWVNGVAPTGTFVKHTDMSGWSTGNDGIPTDWVIQNYTPTSVTKSITLQPTTVDVASAATSTTVNIIAENCNYSSMTYVTGGSFAITVADVQNNVMTLTFSPNTGTTQRVGTLTFTLYDTEGGMYAATVSVSQAPVYVPPTPVNEWSIANNTGLDLSGSLTTTSADISIEIESGGEEVKTEPTPVYITGFALTANPMPPFPENIDITLTNTTTGDKIYGEYNSSEWVANGDLTVNAGETLSLDRA